MSSSTDLTVQQLEAARIAAWHQSGNAITTAEAARTMIEAAGLLAFAPRAAALGAPAPSLVEATLGEAREEVTAAQSDIARQFTARLTGEGSVVPLNLLGSAGATPDFLASAKVFSYVFTLLGDKAWKQPPSTSEGSKVSPLALRVYESLSEKGSQTAAELASELGREVTETAIARALNELWAMLRVLPQLQLNDSATIWELATKRFSKAIKAGANAGQPSALSALLSLYLSQSILATEEEAVAFLSPLTARSRAREVVHALVAARQLDTVVVEGRTLLYVVGEMPAFAAAALPPAELAEGEEAVPAESARPKKVGTGRISRFEGADAAKSSFRGKPTLAAAAVRTSKPFREGGAKRSFSAGAGRSAGPARGAKLAGRTSRPELGRPDTERRPFRRAEAGAKPSFSRPWEEDKRPKREGAGESTGERKPYERKPYAARSSESGSKPYVARDAKPYAARGTGASRPAFGERKPYTPREGRPFTARSADAGAERKSFAPRKPYAPRTGASADGERKPYERKPYAPRTSGSGDGERRPYERKTFAPRATDGERKPYERKPYAPRAGASSAGERRPYERKTFTPRSADGERKPYERKPYAPRSSDSGSKPYAARERKPFTPREGDGERKPFAKAGDSFSKFRKPEGGSRKPAGDAGRSFGDKPAYGAGRGAGAGGFTARPRATGASSFGAKKFGAKKPGGFAKRPEGAAPRKRKPASEE